MGDTSFTVEHSSTSPHPARRGGKVVDPQHPSDHAIVAFNARVAADPRIEHVPLSVRNGIMLARKLRD